MSQKEETTSEEEILEKTASRIRRVGAMFFLGLGALVFLPMIVGTIQGVQQGQAWDPFTSLPVSTDEAGFDCREEAGSLIYDAGAAGEVTARWEERFRLWVSRCQDEHLELFDLLELTRTRLQESEVFSTSEVDDEEAAAPAGD